MLPKNTLFHFIRIVFHSSCPKVSVPAVITYDPYRSRLLSLRRKSNNPITNTPSSLYNGARASLVMIIFLNPSCVSNSDLCSCSFFASSGCANADWIYYLFEPLLHTKSISRRFRIFFPVLSTSFVITTPTSTLKPLTISSLKMIFSIA